MNIDNDVMELTDAIGDAVNGNDFDTVMNALVYMLAHGGYSSGLKKEEFIERVTEHLGNLFDVVAMDNDASTSITSN